MKRIFLTLMTVAMMAAISSMTETSDALSS